MKKLILVVILSVFYAAVTNIASAQSPANPQTITLKDGTVLKGQLMGVNGETYTIQTPTMGSIKVNAANINSITAGNSAPTSTQPATPLNLPSMSGAAGGQMQQLQSVSQGLLTDPEISTSVQQILGDPELMGLVQNLQFLTQILSSDPQQIKNDPSIQKFMQNPKVQNVMSKIKQKMTTSPESFQGLIPAQK